MSDTSLRLLAVGAIVAPALHTLTDALEWVQGGFSGTQLILNYLAFLPVPVLMAGLFAVQRPRISLLGLAGALLYGFAFIYFAHTTFLALETGTPTYEQLWAHLGWPYTLHGGIMVAGGFAFGLATLSACVLPRWTAWLFLLGNAFNLILAFIAVPELLQTVGTLLRNAGLMGMGYALLRPSPPMPVSALAERNAA